MPGPSSVERRLLLALGGIACVAVIGVVAILPYRLYQRDVRHAKVQAHRISSVTHASLSHAVERGEDIGDLVNRLQGIGDFEVRLVRLGTEEGHPAAGQGRGSSALDGTILTYDAAPILGPDGGRWLATMTFDLTPMKRESVRLIIDLILAVVLGSAVFSAVVYWLVRGALLVPLHEVTRAVRRMETSTEAVEMPEFQTSEMAELGHAIERACEARAPAGLT